MTTVEIDNRLYFSRPQILRPGLALRSAFECHASRVPQVEFAAKGKENCIQRATKTHSLERYLWRSLNSRRSV